MLADLVDRLVLALPAPLRRRVRPAHVRLLAQFTQFGFVGVAGFLVDTAVVYAVRNMVGLYVAGTLAYAVAVTCTWWLNRGWTFRGLGNVGPMHRQWMKFVVMNMPGLCLNLGTYFVLIATMASAACARNAATPAVTCDLIGLPHTPANTSVGNPAACSSAREPVMGASGARPRSVTINGRATPSSFKAPGSKAIEPAPK